MKTSELTGAALDWAVAQAEGFDWYIEVKPTAYGPKPFVFEEHGEVSCKFQPATNWAQGGPIIEQNGITITAAWDTRYPFPGGVNGCAWCASLSNCGQCLHYGPTPLIAAMRCYVASKLGDNIDIPEELE